MTPTKFKRESETACYDIDGDKWGHIKLHKLAIKDLLTRVQQLETELSCLKADLALKEKINELL